MNWDFFICHASEDKQAVVEPLATLLTKRGYRVWLDRFVMKMGDDLLTSIDSGLSKSRFGIVVFSPSFFQKNWSQAELGGLLAREMNGNRRVILPVWHELGIDEMVEQSPIFAGRLGARTADGIAAIATQAVAVLEDDDIGLPTLEGKFEAESTEIRQGGVVVGHTLEPIAITGVTGDEICIGTVHGISGRLSTPQHLFQQQFEYGGRSIEVFKVGRFSQMVSGLAGSRITDVVVKILA